ncbi:MAG: peptidylprolyl isomerase [Planctomycetes bacterium]|nr:peptidylprolyl isomerase [Planctomycetota bacterium]
MLARIAFIMFVLSFLACTSAPAITVDNIKPFNPTANNNADNELRNSNEYIDILESRDYSDDDVLFSMMNDRNSMPFNPANYYEFPPLPGMTEFYQADETNNENADANPVIAKINGEIVRAVEFTDRMYQRHREWFEVFVKEIFVAKVAEIEADWEGLEFSEKYVKDANSRIFNLLTTRAQKEGKSFKQVWKEQGFETEKAYRKRWRKYTERMLLLEHLIFLLYFRTNKAEYSHIVLSDKKDSLNPDPLGRAKGIAEKIKQGKITWEKAVRNYSKDHRTLKNNGKVGMILQGTTGLPKIEEFLFAHKAGDISNPIQTVFGYQIIRIDKVIKGKKDATYAELRAEIEAELKRVYKEHIPGLRITNQDSFDWLENMMRQKRCELKLYYPAHLDRLPSIGHVNDIKISAGEFFVHTFESKPEWARQIVSEILIFQLAKREADHENIKFKDEKVDEALSNVMKYLEKQTDSHKKIIVEYSDDDAKNRSKLWYKLGYRSEADFTKVIRRLTVEAMQIERLIMLQDYHVDRIKLYHILCLNEKEAINVRAEIIRVRAKKVGTFESVARKLSRHKKSRVRGGLIGLVPHGTFSSEFEDAAFALKVGRISKPVKTDHGWHILYVTEKIPARVDASFADLQGNIEKELASRGNVPGKRITTSDMYRWVKYIIGTKRYKIKTFIPDITEFTPEVPKDEEDSPLSD